MLARTQVKHVVTTQIGDLLTVPRRWLVNAVVKRVKKLVPPWRIERTVTFRTALRLGRGRTLKEVTLGSADIALLQYTGGTTGTSKGAVLTHGNLIANVLQGFEWAKGGLEEGNEVIVTALPSITFFP